jgi:pectinesterase
MRASMPVSKKGGVMNRILVKVCRHGAVAGLLLLTTSFVHAAPKLLKVTVAHEGKADFQSVQEAVDHAPDAGEIIHIAPGTYREKLNITKANIHLIGKGARAQDVVLTWNDSSKSAGGTSRSASITVSGDGFEAENLTMENTWEMEHPEKENRSQAVALLVLSDRAVFDRVRFIGAQDTLYANSHTCRDGEPAKACVASRQYFNDCYVEGHVDYIFGNANAVFNHCELHSRVHDMVTITAQSRHYPAEVSGYTFLHCRITGPDNGNRVYLGRPWRDYSTVLFYDTEMVQPMDPAGWLEWGGRLKTSSYREYLSHGPGVNGGNRIVSSPELTDVEKAALTPAKILAGSDKWNPEVSAKKLRAE